MGGIVDTVTSIFEGPPDVPSAGDTIEAQKRANRLNQITPYGNINFGSLDAEGNFQPFEEGYETVQMSLSPEQEFLRNQRLELAKQFGAMSAPSASTEYLQGALPDVSSFIGNLPGVGTSGDVMSSLAQGGDINALSAGMPELRMDFAGENQRAADAVYGRGMNYLAPEMQMQRESRLADLAARGIPVGSEAFGDEMGRVDRSQQQQLENLAMSAIGAGNQEAARLFGQTAQARGQLFGEQANIFQLAEGQNMQDYTQGMGALQFDEQQRQNRMNEQMRALQGALSKQGTIAGIENQRGRLASSLSAEPQNFVNVPGVDAQTPIQNEFRQGEQRYQQGLQDVFSLGQGFGFF